MRKSSERGAVAVELALILPLLIFLVLGTVEFGRALNTQITLTHAAREGVRVMAISGDAVVAKNATSDAAPLLDPAQMTIAINPVKCSPHAQVTVTISYELETLTGIAGPFSLTGKGVMSCGG